MILSSLVAIPLLTMLLLFLRRRQCYVRAVAVAGFGVQLIVTVVVVALYLKGVPLDFDVVWYPQLNIHYSLSVDGISVLMLLLSSVVGLCGIFSSWEMERDFFVWYSLLAVGVFGFFIRSTCSRCSCSMRWL